MAHECSIVPLLGDVNMLRGDEEIQCVLVDEAKKFTNELTNSYIDCCVYDVQIKRDYTSDYYYHLLLTASRGQFDVLKLASFIRKDLIARFNETGIVSFGFNSLIKSGDYGFGGYSLSCQPDTLTQTQFDEYETSIINNTASLIIHEMLKYGDLISRFSVLSGNDLKDFVISSIDRYRKQFGTNAIEFSKCWLSFILNHSETIDWNMHFTNLTREEVK